MRTGAVGHTERGLRPAGAGSGVGRWPASDLDDQDEVAEGDEGEPDADQEGQHADHVVAGRLPGADGTQAVDDAAVVRHTRQTHVTRTSHTAVGQRPPSLRGANHGPRHPSRGPRDRVSPPGVAVGESRQLQYCQPNAAAELVGRPAGS